MWKPRQLCSNAVCSLVHRAVIRWWDREYSRVICISFKSIKYLNSLSIGEVKGRLHWCHETCRNNVFVDKFIESEHAWLCACNNYTKCPFRNLKLWNVNFSEAEHKSRERKQRYAPQTSMSFRSTAKHIFWPTGSVSSTAPWIILVSTCSRFAVSAVNTAVP